MMGIARWHRDPWSVFDELEALERDLGKGLTGLEEQRQARRRDVYPPMNVWVSAEGLVADVELPGVDPKEVDISVAGDEMTISGKLADEAEPRDMVARRREREVFEFSRTLRLPFRANAAGVKAGCKNGILRVSVPRSEEDKPRRIAVEAA
jgi:HSP20 family protein